MTTDDLRKASTAIYIAVEGSVAKDVAEKLIWAANRIDFLEKKIQEAKKWAEAQKSEV